MLTTKLVIRVLDAEGQLLGWTEAYGEARGDGALWIEPAPQVPIDQAGTPAWLSVHWCDVNVEVRRALVSAPRKHGDRMTPVWSSGPALVVGPAAGGLPPVTVRDPIAIGVPVGTLGTRTA